MKRVFGEMIWLISMLTGCVDQGEIQQKLLDAYNNSNGDEYLVKVLELNDQYPDNFYINIDLGYIYLLKNDFYSAKKYLETAQGNRIAKDAEWNYKLYGALSDLHYAQERWQDSIDAGLTALENNSQDPIGIKLTIARAYSQIDNLEQGYSAFKEVFMEQPELLKYSDWNNISELSIRFQDFDYTYTLWMEYWRRHGYEPGLGLRISVLSGKLGRVDESLITGFIDLDFQLAYNLIG